MVRESGPLPQSRDSTSNEGDEFTMNDICRLLSLTVLSALAGCGGGGGSTPPVTPTPPPVAVVADWQTFQGDAAHTGHVDASYTASAIVPAWTWNMPSGTRNWMNLVATGGGKIYVTEDAQQSHLYALDEASGAVLWSKQFIDSLETGGPAYANGVVYVTAQTGAELSNGWAADLHMVDAGTGVETATARVHSQMGQFFPVTPFKTAVYSANDDFFSLTGGSYDGTELTSFSSDGSTRNWIDYQSLSYSYTSQSVAADDDHVYFYRSYSSGGLSNALVVLDRSSGTAVEEIADTRNRYADYAYYGAPMISSPGHVVAFSDGQFVTSVSLEESFHSRALIRYDIAAGAISWTTADEYIAAPAVSQGTVFAASNTVNRMDAIDEQTGSVQWSWLAPPGEMFIRNIVAANNLVFVSTDRAVYAIDMTTHRQVWSTASPGALAIASLKYLLVASPARRDNATATLTAFHLG
jgi:outer membrane protein assembly factor BamB